MGIKMEKINKFLFMIIAMVAIMITAVGIDKGLKYHEAQKWEKERVARYEQARAEVADMQLTISELSKDEEAIAAFIEENREYFDEFVDAAEFEAALTGMRDGQTDASGNLMQDALGDGEGDISGNEWYAVSGNMSENADISGNETGAISEYGEDVSGNRAENTEYDSEINGQAVSDNEVSENLVEQEASGNGLNDVSGNENGSITASVSGNTLLEKRKMRGSYMETQIQNEIDQNVIEESTCDFSGISIACLGDSITQASNLDSMEDYQQYAYPTRLKEILGAESVTNLGIGGSSIGRYWEQAFVDRYTEIPQGTDLIIVMGGTNDGFCLTKEELGSMEERKAGTFVGDLDELMRGLKENYPDAKIIFATPLPNVLHDILRIERDYLLPQVILVNIMKQLAAEYEIPVIDLYNSNMLDTHDAAVIYNYMPDGVHCNPDGYMVLAEHLAAEVIKLYEDNETTVAAGNAEFSWGKEFYDYL